MSFLDRDRIVAKRGFNRWVIPPAALAIHLSIGQIYAFSVFKTSLVAHFDGGLTAVAITFSIAIVFLGIAAAFSGAWIERNGPRKAMVVSALCFCSGLIVGGLGIQFKLLWLLYLGYGVLSGIGLGIGYISPVSTLIKWFPDRPGMATGLAIMGFGGGALIASPLSNYLLAFFDEDFNPARPGSIASGGALAATFIALGIIYLGPILFGALIVRVPPPSESGLQHRASHGWGGAQVTAREAMWTTQFSLIWLVLFC
ncbi:MAG: MFS transporter, partial [Angustibacter sp.]